MKTLSLLAVVGLAIAFPTGMNAAERPETNRVKSLTLAKALELAESRHPDLAEARSMIGTAEGRAAQAGLFPNPEAIARMESAPIEGRTTGEAEYLAGISQPLPLTRRLSKARKTEELQRQGLEYQLQARRAELRRRVHNAFATALFQENAYQAQKELADDAARLVSIVKARVQAGDAIPQEVARVELENERTRMELQRVAALRERALISLAGAVGDPRLSIESLSGSLEETWEIPTLNDLVDGLRTHPAFLAGSSAVETSRARLDLSKSQRIPDVRVDLLYRRLEGEKRNAFDLGFSIPLPLFDRNQGRVREAEAELAAAEARARANENDLTSRLRETYAILSAALNGSQAFQSNIVPKTETVLKTAQERYTLGDLSLSELLLARRDSSAIKLTRLELLRGVMEAWAELRALAVRYQ